MWLTSWFLRRSPFENPGGMTETRGFWNRTLSSRPVKSDSYFIFRLELHYCVKQRRSEAAVIQTLSNRGVEMISQLIKRTISLAAVGILTASAIVFAQTQAAEPVVETSKKTVNLKTTGTAVVDTESKPVSSLAGSQVEATTPKEGDVAASRESVDAEVPVNRFFNPEQRPSGIETSMGGSKTKATMPTKQSAASSGWEFSFAPYLYATGISGTVGARGRVLEVDASFGNVLENLDIGLMGTFEARKGKLIFLSDLVWTKMSAERDTPGGLYSTAKVGVNLFIFDPEVGYRVYESKAGSFDVLGGVRIWSVENNINLTTGLLPGFDVSQRKSWAAPVVGFHGLLNLSPKFFLSTKFDIGGAGIGADLTTQFYGGGGYRITPKIALIGGYRYLQVDYDDSEGFLFDTKMNGLVIGARFNF